MTARLDGAELRFFNVARVGVPLFLWWAGPHHPMRF